MTMTKLIVIVFINFLPFMQYWIGKLMKWLVNICRNMVQFPAIRIFFRADSIWDPSSLLSKVHCRALPWDWSGQRMQLTTNLHAVHWGLPAFPLYVSWHDAYAARKFHLSHAYPKNWLHKIRKHCSCHTQRISQLMLFISHAYIYIYYNSCMPLCCTAILPSVWQELPCCVSRSVTSGYGASELVEREMLMWRKEKKVHNLNILKVMGR
jgi:hypothetical protein